MFEDRAYSELTVGRTQSILSTLLGVLAAAGRVTVLLFLMGAHGAAHGEDVHVTDLSVFQFSCEFQVL